MHNKHLFLFIILKWVPTNRRPSLCRTLMCGYAVMHFCVFPMNIKPKNCVDRQKVVLLALFSDFRRSQSLQMIDTPPTTFFVFEKIITYELVRQFKAKTSHKSQHEQKNYCTFHKHTQNTATTKRKSFSRARDMLQRSY